MAWTAKFFALWQRWILTVPLIKTVASLYLTSFVMILYLFMNHLNEILASLEGNFWNEIASNYPMDQATTAPRYSHFFCLIINTGALMS